jgi:hypothetical protein
MNAAPHPREEEALALLMAHCSRLDPDHPTARERLEETLGAELANRLVFALCAGTSRPRACFAA